MDVFVRVAVNQSGSMTLRGQKEGTNKLSASTIIDSVFIQTEATKTIKRQKKNPKHMLNFLWSKNKNLSS